ncbi:MAG: GntR family transcriptional regulator [Pseudomonadota bacterium]
MSMSLGSNVDTEGAAALAPLRAEPGLVDLVHERLVEAISVGRLPPGERLTQGRVADLLDVSRQPVSHALQLLKHQGLAVQHKRKGLAVAPLNALQIWHLYQVRGMLDGLAARLAAERIVAGLAPSTEITAIEEALDHGRSLDPSSGTIDLVRADVAFHRALHDLSGNPEIARTVTEQWPQFMRSMAVVLDEPDRKLRIWDEHAAILEAVLAGDAARAESLACSHAVRAGRETRERIDRLDLG